MKHATFSLIVALAATIGRAEGPGDPGAPGPAPPRDLKVQDVPDDAGQALQLTWLVSPDDWPGAGERRVSGYVVRRSTETDGAFGPFVQVGRTDPGATEFIDQQVKPGQRYRYEVAALAAGGTPSRAASLGEPVASRVQFFNTTRAWFGVLMALVCGAVIWYIYLARTGRELKMRRIPGLEAIDEAVGRSVEMGRSCLFIPGIQDINDIQTVAGITILARVAKTAATYDAAIEVPTCRSLVMTAARQMVEEAYLGAGRPDAYQQDLIYYVTDEQFGYVAAVAGTMVRQRPAACFYMGSFFAESLILAETGNSIGAIQIAGTGQPSQLPFFVAACDYTLIGEEFFAASAYLSGKPDQLGTLKGQDMGKLLGAAVLLAGSVLATVAAVTDAAWAREVVEYLRTTVLG